MNTYAITARHKVTGAGYHETVAAQMRVELFKHGIAIEIKDNGN